MKPSSVMLDEVVVTANMVTREADRFVVNVAATPLSAGKTGKEMLALSPGVWITDKGDLSVNGRGGTQVIVNDRVLKETGEELVAYLENLKAEDILKIEVIPYAGAEYDANATGGVIKITLKKQREEGLEGAVSMRYYTSIVDQKAWNYQPSLNLNYKYNALSLYSEVGYRRNNWTGGNMESDRFLRPGTGSWMQTPVWHIANPTPLFNWQRLRHQRQAKRRRRVQYDRKSLSQQHRRYRTRN